MREPQRYKELQRVRKTPGPSTQNSQLNKLQGGGEVKELLRPANFTLGPDVTFNTEIHKFRFV